MKVEAQMKIAFIGVGTMGRGMAANLQKAGYALVINDLASGGSIPRPTCE